MNRVEISQEQVQEDQQLNYLADILVEAFLDYKVTNDPSFTDPRIHKPIHDLIRDSKEREKFRKEDMKKSYGNI